jgi:hypothetical protein
VAVPRQPAEPPFLGAVIVSAAVITALVEIGPQPTVAARALAAQVEAAIPAHLQLAELELRPGIVPALAPLDRLVGQLLEGTPSVVVIGCTIWNVEVALELCARLHRLAPETSIVLGGAEAVGRREVARRAGVRAVLEGAPAPALIDLLRELGCRGRGGGRRAVGTAYHTRLGELDRSAARVTMVEADLGAGVPLCLDRYVRPARRLARRCPPALAADDAAWRVAPLLRMGAQVLLRAPAISAQPEQLRALLRRLPAADGRLELELGAELLDEELIDELATAGVGCVDLDLAALGCEALEPERLRRVVGRLVDRGIGVRGALVYGPPALGHDELTRAVDRAVAAGIESLQLHRLVLPPWSALRRDVERAGLRFSPTPPYTVLGTVAARRARARGPVEDLLRTARFVAAYAAVHGLLSGTGLLRVLGQQVGSAAEVIEGFYGSLAASGHDLLLGEPPGNTGRLFLDYLRRHHGVDLELSAGKVQLHRAPLLALRWLDDGRRLITDDSTGRIAHVGRSALTLLDRFDEAAAGYEVCERVLAEAPDDQRDRLRRELHRTLEKLVSMSFLVPARQAPLDEGFEDEVPFTSLEEFDYHYRMLTDTARVEAYRQAIELCARSGVHAVEIGTGTGILAVFAAQAGARVTAIERFSVLGIARAVARLSGVAEKIHFVRGRSDLVELEERGDVLISEIVGNRILNEGLLETTLDARERLVKPGATLIPRRVEILAELGQTDRFRHLTEALDGVGEQYRISLAPLVRWFEARLRSGHVIWELGSDDEGFVPLASETSLIELDLQTLTSADFSRTVTVVPRREGLANAVVLAFRLELAPGINLTTSGRHGLHWSKPVLMLRRPLAVRPDRPVALHVSYETHGELLVAVERL